MLILRREAEQDIQAAYAWYEERRPNLGKERGRSRMALTLGIRLPNWKFFDLMLAGSPCGSGALAAKMPRNRPGAGLPQATPSLLDLVQEP